MERQCVNRDAGIEFVYTCELHESRTSNGITHCNFTTIHATSKRFYSIKTPEQACHQRRCLDFCKQTIILLLRTPEGFHSNKSVLTGHVHMSRCHQDVLYIFHNTTPERHNCWPLSLNTTNLGIVHSAACVV